MHRSDAWWHPSLVSWLVRYLRSSIGAKHVMAVTGLLLLLFALTGIVVLAFLIFHIYHKDALVREESCGGHFRTEHQVEGEAKRDDDNFCHVAVWEHGDTPKRHTEQLVFEHVKLATRSYK